MGPYAARSAKILWCPTNIYLSDAQRALGWPNRVQSVAMDAAIGDGDKDFADLPWLTFVARKMGVLQTPGPGGSWLFMKEHPDSIDDALLYSNPGSTNGIGVFTELPSGNHAGRRVWMLTEDQLRHALVPEGQGRHRVLSRVCPCLARV